MPPLDLLRCGACHTPAVTFKRRRHVNLELVPQMCIASTHVEDCLQLLLLILHHLPLVLLAMTALAQVLP